MNMSAIISTKSRMCASHIKHLPKSEEGFAVLAGLSRRRLRPQKTPIARWLSGGQTLEIRQVRVRDAAKSDNKKATIYTANKDDWITVQQPLQQQAVEKKGNALTTAFQDKVITHFLPAQFPNSVAPGYARFAAFGFGASVAGSAAMVLSTQTLLLAVGVVGSSQQASVMAGALNWVLKDGIGQLGGVLFASRMGQAGSAKFDADPKRWRMVAALSMDCATLLEILSPLVPSVWVLPIASVANIGKNIGFLTASASRAALHQSLAISGNLADLTAKAGSQSLAASLVGTALGISLSPILGDVFHFTLGFVCLSAMHQGCNYISLKAVPLFNLNRQRLNLIMQEFVKDDTVVLSPSQVAQKEVFLPLISKDDSKTWLAIGSALPILCPGGPDELRRLVAACPGEKYVINASHDDKVHLVFQQEATGEDLIRGVLHAHLLRNQMVDLAPLEAVSASYGIASGTIDALLEEMKNKGWKTGTEYTSVESSKACRLSIVES